MTEYVEVLLRRDVHTALGILPRGSTQDATPAPDGRWWVRVADVDAVIVPEAWIYAGHKRRAALNTAREVREEYWFARDVLAFSHPGAVKWIAERYHAQDTQLRRWGLYADRPVVPQ